ncbi:MAG: hypothetical protein COZ06_33765 [Armatimonadetes bacterium CG_4_10_14_3_um_filter_66_18]|nr:hypothetical protein [Armatimonadota bacterium]OIP01338.1 MAG: hypothetical protein AUJ96_17480 [Armatimonadetes bacterium CG2_30_66_41]PIU95453.1 MAG: hypothetical protein COS65_02370 [Armatimonadetes bacterium CG06_land_8_20_14_3_00_66_21]PIX36678.1 MAG: hypothetical protein COZ57_38255 [Armatimonadetes bacterium CG_4_8_14_3_um_filter_66_20]PIY36966.1 MAG: hypothetical protein COZ06_33765 [Armatimonadetes bacterium CG_4_10_14_3_um_filter_66_18]PIZ39520.1 MAG: hypothetical protein COY42_22
MVSHPCSWRLSFAALGTAGHWLLRRSDWTNPPLLLYDVPTLTLSFSLAGSVVGRLVTRQARTGDRGLLGLLCALLVLSAVGEPLGWPFSGHLLWATASAVLECGEAQNAKWFRVAAFLPAALLVGIRTFFPQTRLMTRPNYTWARQ